MLESIDILKKREEFLSIGEFSKISRVSIDSLRYYERKGIFMPAYVDPSSNYRYYRIEQIYELTLAKVCSEIGYSLSNLREFSTKRDLVTLEEFFGQCEEATKRAARRSHGLALRMHEYKEAYIKQISEDVLSERDYLTKECTVLLSPINCAFEDLVYQEYMETVSALIKNATELDLIFLAEQGIVRHPNNNWYVYVNILPEEGLHDIISSNDSLLLYEAPSMHTKIRSTMGSRISDAFHNALTLDKSKTPLLIQEAWAYSLATDFYLFNVFYSCE